MCGSMRDETREAGGVGSGLVCGGSRAKRGRGLGAMCTRNVCCVCIVSAAAAVLAADYSTFGKVDCVK